VDAIVESGTPLTVDVHVHDTSNSPPELVESSISGQIFRCSFATPLIEAEIDHETLILVSLHLVGYLSPLALIMILWLFLPNHLLMSL